MVKTIAHLADIHIRKLHRFVEYRKVFKQLYKQLKQLKPDLIYIGGDVVHGKLDTSPEEVRMVANFFLSLCKIAPTIVIPGNHDCNLNNKSREDTLSPIVDLVQKITPNLHYWKKSGVYTIDNVDFGVMSIFDIDCCRIQIFDAHMHNFHNFRWMKVFLCCLKFYTFLTLVFSFNFSKFIQYIFHNTTRYYIFNTY